MNRFDGGSGRGGSRGLRRGCCASNGRDGGRGSGSDSGFLGSKPDRAAATVTKDADRTCLAAALLHVREIRWLFHAENTVYRAFGTVAGSNVSRATVPACLALPFRCSVATINFAALFENPTARVLGMRRVIITTLNLGMFAETVGSSALGIGWC